MYIWCKRLTSMLAEKCDQSYSNTLVCMTCVPSSALLRSAIHAVHTWRSVIWWPYPITPHPSNWPPGAEINHALLQLTCLHWVWLIFQPILPIHCLSFSFETDVYSLSLYVYSICFYIASHSSICTILQLYVRCSYKSQARTACYSTQQSSILRHWPLCMWNPLTPRMVAHTCFKGTKSGGIFRWCIEAAVYYASKYTLTYTRQVVLSYTWW